VLAHQVLGRRNFLSFVLLVVFILSWFLLGSNDTRQEASRTDKGALQESAPAH